MQIKTAEFVKGIIGSDAILKDHKPHIAFVGRSNVGKSSLINSLCNRNSLVKVSSQPGKTTEINFFLINNEYYFVDLPGYGYAQVSQKEQEKIRRWIVWYLQTDEVENKKVVLVLDIKVGITEFDSQVLAILKEMHTPCLIVANKADVLKPREQHLAIQAIQTVVGDMPQVQLLMYSSKTNLGRDELTWRIFR